MLKDAEIAISMDGKGAWRDSVFVERLWRTVKYEEVYLRAYASVSEARASIGRYLSLRTPGPSGQAFRFRPIGDCDLIRSPIPGHPVTLPDLG